VRNSRPAPSFFRFTPLTFIVARGFFAKSWKLFRKTSKSAPTQRRNPSGRPLQLRLELSPGENFVVATRVVLEWARAAIACDASADGDLEVAAVFAVVRP
jgi:hypothetical protein